MDSIVLQGGGEHARVVLDGLLSSGKKVMGLFDPKYTGELMGVPQLGTYQSSKFPDAKALVAIGDNAQRKKVVAATMHDFTNFIHQSAVLSNNIVFGTGDMIMHGVIVQVNTRIGNHVILNTGSRIDHDCVIGDYVHIAPGAVLCGTVSVGEGAFIGAGAIIIPGISIGAWSRVGAGAVVVRDVEAHTTVAGNPAKALTKRT